MIQKFLLLRIVLFLENQFWSVLKHFGCFILFWILGWVRRFNVVFLDSLRKNFMSIIYGEDKVFCGLQNAPCKTIMFPQCDFSLGSVTIYLTPGVYNETSCFLMNNFQLKIQGFFSNWFDIFVFQEIVALCVCLQKQFLLPFHICFSILLLRQLRLRPK
jgi:hypothetical protein